jgi:hypothetical protein
MGNPFRRRVRTLARVAACAWLLVLAPAELATTLARLISGPAGQLGAVAAALITLRLLVTAAGLMIGRRVAAGTDGMRRAALVWAAADLATLALVLASARLPSNRAPGDAALVWSVYALAALVVVAAAAPAPVPAGEP